MQFGDTVLILPSYALVKMRLGKLAGVKATLIRTVRHGKEIRGYWVKLPFEYMGESEWFIPYNSIG